MLVCEYRDQREPHQQQKGDSNHQANQKFRILSMFTCTLMAIKSLFGHNRGTKEDEIRKWDSSRSIVQVDICNIATCSNNTLP